MRSFCAAFSSTFCLADFPASVTSACSLTGAAPHCFLFAGHSYWRLRNPSCQRLPQPRFCGGALAAKAPCALRSDSAQTGARVARLAALTAHSKRPLMAHPASLRRRGARSVFTPQNHLLRRPSCYVRFGDSARHKDSRSILPLGKSSFPGPSPNESAFKTHS